MDTRRNKRGFTIVEILAAIVILGVLMGVAIPLVIRYISKGKNLSYETMENTIYYAAKNYVMDENIYLDNCTKGFFDIEQGQDNILSDLQYAEKFVDPNDKNKKCIYNVYGCMENEASGAALPTYKYKIELKCIDHLSCKIYRDDGSISACDMTDDGSGDGSDDESGDQTNGPKCGTYSPNNTTWSNIPSVTINLNCEDGNSMGCEKENYTQTFTEEGKTGSIQIKDVLGNKTTCSVNTYIDRTAPSKPIITNPNDNKWTNKSYKIQISSVDKVSGIKYFEYRYPNSSVESERNWVKWVNSSKGPNDSSNFMSTDFSKERDEIVEVRACDYAGNCSETSTTHIKIDKTKPVCSINVNGTKGENNWYISNANLSLTFSDSGGSGISSYDLSKSQTASFEGKTTASQNNTTGITYYGHVKDQAGNVGKCNSDVLMVDVDGPVIGDANISASGSTRYILTNLSDNTAKINGYTVTTSDSVGTFTDISPVSTHDLKINVPPSAGTYYIWARNEAGHVSKKVVNVPALTYTIQYNMNGGTGNIPDQTKVHDVNINLSSAVPTKNQYKFLGWATYPTATTPDYNAGSIFNLNQSITLYAVWKKAMDVPVFTYTGSCEIVDDNDNIISDPSTWSGNWKIRFLTSGQLTFTSLNGAANGIDVFLVGGGGGANMAGSGYNLGGGGGGYTRTVRRISATSTYITIGQGGAGGKDGGSLGNAKGGTESSAFGYKAAGGNGAGGGGYNIGGAKGGNGGSGGGSGSATGIYVKGGNGGSNGSNGFSGGGTSSSDQRTVGFGQISVPGPNGETGNTREFGEEGKRLYAAGGGGSPGYGAWGTSGDGGQAPNTGGGGNAQYPSGQSGFSGIVIIRNAR